MRRQIVRSFTLLALVGVSALTGSCSCSKSEPVPEGDAGGEHVWAIHINVPAAEGGRRVIDVGPVATSTWTDPEDEAKVATKLVVVHPDGSQHTVAPQTSGASRRDWALLHGAASQCGLTNFVVLPPWSTPTAWYLFADAPTKCSELLARESQLLCMADKLVEIDSAVAPITWKDVPALADIAGGDWILPVQSEKDRVVVREMAQSLLAHLARLDAYPVRSTVGGQGNYGSGTCSRLLSRGMRETAFATAEADLLFGSPVGGPTAFPSHSGVISTATVKTFAADSLALEAHMLRAGGRMLEGLIRRSFYADLAGAERRKAATLDHLRGTAIAWGLRDNENGTYNSMAHAARVLSGRWELGPSQPDPACGGVAAPDVLARTYGADGPRCTTTAGVTTCTPGARDTDVPTETPGQANASKLLASTGVLLAPGAVAGTDIKAIVKQQLKGKIAAASGLATTGDLNAALGSQAQAIDAQIDKIPTEDFRFAAQRTLRTYQMLVNTAVAPSTTRRKFVPGMNFPRAAASSGSASQRRSDRRHSEADSRESRARGSSGHI